MKKYKNVIAMMIGLHREELEAEKRKLRARIKAEKKVMEGDYGSETYMCEISAEYRRILRGVKR